MKIGKSIIKMLLLIVFFSVAMGFLEGSVAYYLHLLPPTPNSLNLPAAPNFPKEILFVEQLRETATVVMLAIFAGLVGKNTWQRLYIFLFLFSIWDLTYYASTYWLMGWPSSIFTMDVVFLIPLQWWFPVFFPVILFTILAIVSGYEILRFKQK